MPLSRITGPSIANNSIIIEDFASARDTAVYSPAANTFAIRTANTERVRVNSSGNTFIGATSAVWDERLGIRPITGTGQVGIGVYSSNTSYASSCIRVQSENGTGANWYMYEGRSQGGAVNYWVDGNGLIYTNQGIKFNGTQQASADANTLDDYEEGTWTPNCIHASTNNSTWATKSGFYVKIGGIVHCWWMCDAGNSGTAGSELVVTGLPFTASASNLSYGTGGAWGTNGSTLSGNHFINAGSSYAKLYRGGNSYTEQQSFASGYFTFRVS